MHWYYADEDVQVGPLTDTEFEDLVRLGKVTDQTTVWHEGLTEWQPYRQVRPLKTPGHVPPPISAKPALRCTECHREFSENELIQYRDSFICTTCKPIFFQRLREGLPMPGTMTYAGFWIRFGAKFIDGLIISVVNMAILLIFGPLLGFNLWSLEPPKNLGFLIFYPFFFGNLFLYSVFFVGRYGATLGKMALGLKIVTSSGDPISYMRALARFGGEWLSYIICYIGYIMAAFDEEKKALHDRICDTRVIRK